MSDDLTGWLLIYCAMFAFPGLILIGIGSIIGKEMRKSYDTQIAQLPHGWSAPSATQRRCGSVSRSPVFEVKLLPFNAYAFRYGILVVRALRGVAGGAWVSK